MFINQSMSLNMYLSCHDLFCWSLHDSILQRQICFARTQDLFIHKSKEMSREVCMEWKLAKRFGRSAFQRFAAQTLIGCLLQIDVSYRLSHLIKRRPINLYPNGTYGANGLSFLFRANLPFWHLEHIWLLHSSKLYTFCNILN